jgi:predicted nucleic acid-binding protein
MADLARAFFDTSVIVGGIIQLGSANDPAQRMMGAVADGRIAKPLTAWHCCLEFFAVATRLPREFRVTPADAARLVEEEILARFAVHALPRARRTSFIRQAALDAVHGGRLYDAHIAEVARMAGADVVVTENRPHFSQLLRHGIRVLTAAEMTDELG